ncbi:MAG TPA: PAS domain S-box protein [Desulfobulbus sp.]|nr:PAS domain S-box protein [Desulfobulbus sp.]
MSKSLKNTLYQRFSMILVCSVVVISGLVIRTERLLLTNDLQDKGDSIARILSSVTLDAVLRHDYATIERYVRDITREKFVTGIEVVRKDGEILAGHNSTQSRNTILTTYPIRMGIQEFGVVKIFFSTSRIDAITWQIVFAAIGVILILHFLGLLLTNMVLNKTVLIPLARLQQAIKTVSTGDFNTLVDPGGPREFETIGTSFNTMAQQLRQSFTEIKKSRQALDLERNKLAAIVAAMADGMFVTDNNALITSFNQSASKITGYLQEEAIGRSCEDLFRTSLCRDACALRHQGETRENVETSMITKDGRKLDVSVSSAILRDKDGERIGGVQTFRDISDEKKRHDLYCRTEKLAAVGQLAAGVAHELNNPLGNIIGYAKMISPDEAPEKVPGRVDVIIEQARKCADIVRGLLDYSRTSASEQNHVDLAGIVRGVAEVLTLQMKKKGVELSLDLQELPRLSADERKVEQVIMNLALNAIQAVEQGGSISIAVRQHGDMARLEVGDNGPGIPEELRCRIFDPFFTTKPVGEGTGLGLAISAGIIDELGGLIELGTPENGALFIVSLPLGSRLQGNDNG